MSKKAFSLIEVIIAVVLLATAGMALLKIGTNNKHIILLTQNYAKTTDLFSVAFNHSNKNFHNTKKSLFDFLQGSYTFSDESAKILKDIKLEYKHKEILHEYFPINENTVIDIYGFEITLSTGEISHKEMSFEVH